MSDATFSRRWLLLSVIGMLTSFLLTIGIAALGMRGTASADQRPNGPANNALSRVPGGVLFIKEIGGPARTATPTVGTAPTLHLTEEPFRPLMRTVPDGSQPPETAESPPLPAAEPRESRAPANRPASNDRAPATTGNAASSWAPTTSPTAQPEPVNAATATPVPALAAWAPTATVVPTAAPPTATATVTATPTKTPARADEPPRVSILLSDSKIDSGDTVTITVSARDDGGLDWIAWEANSGERALDRENRADCDDRTTCVQSWTVRVNRVGTHTIEARARGTSGLRSEEDEAYLKVRERATPTATPTGTATPTSASAQAKR